MRCTHHKNGKFIKQEDGWSMFCTEGIKEMQSHKTNGTMCQKDIRDKEVKV